MDAKFTRIYNSLAGTHFRSAQGALRQHADPVVDRRAQRDADLAFNILAVSEGLRDAALMPGVPPTWAPADEWGLHVVPVIFRKGQSSVAVFVARSAAMTQEQVEGLVGRYVVKPTRRHDILDVEREMGRRLGYLQPMPTGVTDGTVTVYLGLPGDRRLASEFGPQTLRVTRDIAGPVQRMQRTLHALAQSVDKGMSVDVDLEFSSEQA